MNFEAIKEAIRNEAQWEALYNAELNHNFGEKGIAGNGFAKPPCRCPLHSEKKASFSVNLSTGIFSCQGCKETGDFFDLVQKKNGLSFPEALRYTAEKLGMNIESLTPLTEEQKSEIAEREVRRQEQAKKQRQDSILKVQIAAQEFIATCTPLNGTGHAYLKKKGVESCEGVLCFENDLVLPYTDIDGVVCNLQKILPKKITLKDGRETDKLFLPGNLKPGLFFTIPGNRDFGYAEGFATGRSVSMATGETILVCGSAHNVCEVIKSNLAKYPDAKHTFYADDEWWKPAKENAGRKVGQKAAKLGITVRYPEFKDDSKQLKDFNDFHVEYGIDELKKYLQKPECKMQKEIPEICILKGKLSEMTDAAEEALITAGYNLFQQGGDLKKITEIRSVNPQKVDFPESLKLISGVQPAYLKEAFSRTANWVKPVKIPEKQGGGYTSEAANPPNDIVEIFQARGEWKLPILSGIIHTPMLFSDGTVLQKNGYDRKTGFYYHKTIDFSIPDKPTLADARKAMEILKYPLSEFPFVDADSQSVVLAGLLTALNRKAFDNAPMFAFNAPTPRTGKGQFCKYISLIATGEHAVLINVPNDRTGQEMEKRLSAALMANSPIWNIDNVSHPFGSDFLCSILTESFIHPRFLGKSENIKSPTNVVVLMTGNNLQIKGDLQGRTLICTIDSGVERPENRQFKLRISDYCLRNRKKLVEAGLTILKAFRISKDKIDIPVWGSFEDWSEWIRKPLVWCGEADPWTANEKARQDDPEITGIKKLMQVWHDTYGNARITVKRLIEDSENNSDLREVIDEICVSQKQTEARQIGYLLRAYKGRIFNGMKFLPSDKSSKSKVSASWFIEKGEKHTLQKKDNDFDLLSIL